MKHRGEVIVSHVSASTRAAKNTMKYTTDSQASTLAFRIVKGLHTVNWAWPYFNGNNG